MNRMAFLSKKELRRKMRVDDFGRKSLDLSEHSLHELPAALGQFTKLEKLLLSKNELTTIPEDIGKLNNLTALYVVRNQLSIFPTSLTQLKKLKMLDISYNKLTTIPDAIGEMVELESLGLIENQLTALSPAIKHLKKLKVLHISQNNLTTIPDVIWEMMELRRLELNDNQLTVLSPAVKQLKKLKKLYISHNKLTTIPDAIGEILELEILDLSYNQMTVFSPAINQLKKLTWLDISHNNLTIIPDALGKMLKLEILDLSYNQLTVLSPAIKQLKKLKKLCISHNKLTTIPNAVRGMVELERLELSYNRLTMLNPAVKQLKELFYLSVEGNPFTVEGIRSVMELEEERTVVITGPSDGVQVDNRFHRVYLNPFTVEGWRIATKQREIFRVYSDIPDLERAKGRKLQLAYERALKDGYVKVYRGRIILVGQDRAGKTSLKKSLLGLPFDPKEQSTEGIEVNPSKCEIDVDQAVKNWQLARESKPVLLESSKDVAKIVADTMCGADISQHKFFEGSLKEVAIDRGKLKLNDEFGDVFKSKQVEEDEDVIDILQNNGNEHSTECKGENMEAEPDVMIDVSQPPDTVKHVNEWLKYAKREPIESALLKEESHVTMDFWDFAGQHLYYASHPVFLSQRALYILVHNLSKPLDAPAEPCVRQGSNDVKLENPNNETNMENLLSWLATIHSVALARDDTNDAPQHKLPYLCPPVLIVGTHADKPVEDIAVIKTKIQKRISGAEYEKHVVRPLFCIDNTQSQNLMKKFIQKIGKQMRKDRTEQKGKVDGINKLQNRILEVLRKEPYMGEKIPVRWFLFEKVIEAFVAKQIYHRNLQQLEHSARKDCFMEDTTEFDAMISFYHGLGMIIKHRGTVVLKAQWLIDRFKELITIPPFNEQNPLHAKYWRELEGSGILSMEHVDHVFSSVVRQGIIKEDILDMMERFGLIAKFSVSSTDVKYFVPAQLKRPPNRLFAIEPSSTDPCPLYLLFVHGFVPHGLFLQLVSRSIHWCGKKWPVHQPTLYQNGACFIIGEDIHDFVLICQTGFVKVILRQKKQSHQDVGHNTAELATVVRKFIEDTLQNLSLELPYLRGLQYRLCVACPYCPKRIEEPRRACSDHIKTTCTHQDCFHLIDANEGKPTICTREVWDEVRPFCGLEKWFVKRTGQGSWSSNGNVTAQGAAAEVIPIKSDAALKVTLLGSEWSSSMGGLSTINRQLAILLAKRTQVDVTLLVPQFNCSEEERRMASSHNVSLKEAPRRTGYADPLDWLSAPPRDLAIDIVLGHGAKLGKQAQFIRESHQCTWIQVVHTAPEELGMHKNYSGAICKGEEKNTTEVELCKLADAVVAVGPKLTKAYSSYLRSCEKHQDIIQLTPSTFSEFSDVKQAAVDMDKFKVLTFGRGDPEDFSLKGYDISARAIVELRDRSYHLIFVGAPDGKQDEVAADLLNSGIDKSQLTVRKFVQSKERLKELLCEVDLCMMPSRTEGFGLTALEALSAGLPILVSGNSGFGEALSTVPSGKSFLVGSEDPKEWAKAIAGVREKERSDRLHEIQQLRSSYEEKFSWEKQCDILVDRMRDIVSASKKQDTSFRTQEAEDVDTSSEQVPIDSLLTPSSFHRFIRELQQMQLGASKVENRTDLSLGLRKIALDKGFRISDNKGSGNCMFHALSEQLEIADGIKIPHGRLRQILVQYLRSNPKLPDGTDLFHFVHGHQTWTEYLTHMEQDGAWGDHVILCAAANNFEMCIRVVSSLPHSNDVMITPHCPVDESKALVLGHIHEVHYVSLQPAQG